MADPPPAPLALHLSDVCPFAVALIEPRKVHWLAPQLNVSPLDAPNRQVTEFLFVQMPFSICNSVVPAPVPRAELLDHAGPVQSSSVLLFSPANRSKFFPDC